MVELLLSRLLVQFMTQDAPFVGGGDSSALEWGIFKDGTSVIDADSMVAFEYKQDWDVSDFPQEEGAFQSYDKVQSAFDIKVRMTRGGNVEARTAFLASIDAIIGTVELYDVHTPEKTYTNVNFKHRDFRRTNDQGPGRIEVELHAVEIRNTATQQFSKTGLPSGKAGTTKSTGGASQSNGGIVQTEDIRMTVSGHLSEQRDKVSGGGGW